MSHLDLMWNLPLVLLNSWLHRKYRGLHVILMILFVSVFSCIIYMIPGLRVNRRSINFCMQFFSAVTNIELNQSLFVEAFFSRPQMNRNWKKIKQLMVFYCNCDASHRINEQNNEFRSFKLIQWLLYVFAKIWRIFLTRTEQKIDFQMVVERFEHDSQWFEFTEAAAEYVFKFG